MLLISDFFSTSASTEYFPVFLSEETVSHELPPGALKPENIPSFFKHMNLDAFFALEDRGIFFY